MSAAKHTPGPWGTHFHAAHGHCITQLNQNGHPMSNDIAVVFMAQEGRSRDEAKSNARLIAAAPDLLEMVRITIGNVRSLGPAGALSHVHAPYQVWLEQLEAAYAKATGAQA